MTNNLPEIPINDVIRMAENVDKYGASVMGMAAFMILAIFAMIIVFWIFFRQSKKKDDEHQSMLKNTMEQNSILLNNLLKGSSTPNDLVQKSVDVGSAIEKHMKFTSAKTKCDRVALYMFHNGQRMLNGNHILKFSCIAEYALLPSYYFADQHRDKMTTSIQPLCNGLMEIHNFTIPNVADLDCDNVMISWCNNVCPIKSMIAKAIFSIEGKIIGFVSLEYLLDVAPEDKLKDIHTEAKILADKVSVAVDLELLSEKED